MIALTKSRCTCTQMRILLAALIRPGALQAFSLPYKDPNPHYPLLDALNVKVASRTVHLRLRSWLRILQFERWGSLLLPFGPHCCKKRPVSNFMRIARGWSLGNARASSFCIFACWGGSGSAIVSSCYHGYSLSTIWQCSRRVGSVHSSSPCRS